MLLLSQRPGILHLDVKSALSDPPGTVPLVGDPSPGDLGWTPDLTIHNHVTLGNFHDFIQSQVSYKMEMMIRPTSQVIVKCSVAGTGHTVDQ